MRKWTIALGSVALVAGGMWLPTWAQPSGRTVTRETLTESTDFIRSGDHVLNRSQIAYVSRTGRSVMVYFVGNVPPLLLPDHGDALMAQLAPNGDPNPRPAFRPSREPGIAPPTESDPPLSPFDRPAVPSPVPNPSFRGTEPREVGPAPTPIEPLPVPNNEPPSTPPTLPGPTFSTPEPSTPQPVPSAPSSDLTGIPPYPGPNH